MAYFSESDINEAKKRVSDMQRRARNLTSNNEADNGRSENEEKSEELKEENKEEKDDSSLIIFVK